MGDYGFKGAGDFPGSDFPDDFFPEDTVDLDKMLGNQKVLFLLHQ